MKYPLFALGFMLIFGQLSCNSKATLERSSATGEMKRVSIQEIEEGIKQYIYQQAEANEGFFLYKDETHDLRFKLVRVHTEYLSNLGEGRYFACVDLADERGDVYDVDFFMEGSPGNMHVTATAIHKLNGKPFYSWKQLPDKRWTQVPLENAGEELLGVKQGVDHFTFQYHVQLPRLEQAAYIWIPLAQSDDYQRVQLLDLTLPFNYQILKDEQGNNILYAAMEATDQVQNFIIRYEVIRKEKSPYAAIERDFTAYLAPNSLIPVGGRFLEIALEATAKYAQGSNLEKARALYDYIIDNMRYMKFGQYGRGDANYACDSKTGNCTEFHSYFISLARSIGIPARFAIGASIPSDRNEGGMDGYHCWAEFYAEGKWWPIDISEANKYTVLATYYFGRHPANRMEFTRGRDLKLATMPQSGPINFLIYPLIELADGTEVIAKTTFTFERQP
jgi:hypothetical protein